MSLFGSIQMAGNTLGAVQIGLQVTGNNISNANTPGYVREQANFVPAGIQQQGSLALGIGVKIDSITEQVDKFVQARLVGAQGDSANASVQNQTYKDLETLLNELSDTNDLSSSLTGFFNSINDVLGNNTPATTNLTVGKGVALAQNVNNLHDRVTDIQNNLDDQISSDADQINNLSETIRQLNVKIVTIEGGNSGGSQAAGLRDQRQTAVDSLSKLLGITVNEQPSGALNISVGGQVLVFEGQRNAVEVSKTSSNASGSPVVQFVGTHAPVTSTTGELQGLYVSRDQIVGGFLSNLDDFSKNLAFEFNKVYSQGQGQTGFTDLTSQEGVSDATAPLDAAGLPFTPQSGSFDILVRTKNGDGTDGTSTKSTTINVDLDGFDGDTTLNDLAKQINAVDGISATVSADGKLEIKSDSSDIDFSFSGDNSGVLASLGVNTFFTGSSAATLGVNDELKGVDNASRFAASSKGIDVGTDNAVKLASLFDQPLDSTGGTSLSDQYTQIINQVTQGSSVAQSVSDGYASFQSSLEGQEQSVSGVSIDEEAVNMMTLQRIYQASAKYISTISELLDELMKM
ncbi:MAG TPA: flagellar hook-associated protein FlgK [Lacipirellulaceae bacterium]|jgi:flagellar hook-associated protein 1 FlgK|nr:flagellar hook-associated protein FlgK [Lacipirellulaceae bacterium]